MKIIKVCCQGCGADLDIGDDIRFITCNYCGVRLEVVRDTTVTHTRQLERIEQTAEQMAGNLKVIELQNELERLDREWNLEREGLMIRNQNGGSSVPGATGSMIGGVIAIVFAVIWMGSAISMGAPAIFPLFGLLFIGVAIYSVISSTTKAGQYSRSESAYQGRRARLIATIEQERNARRNS